MNVEKALRKLYDLWAEQNGMTIQEFRMVEREKENSSDDASA